jgi:hypothetical protein
MSSYDGLGGHRLAERYVVVAGDPSAAKSLLRMGSRREQIPSAVGQVDEIELRHGLEDRSPQ